MRPDADLDYTVGELVDGESDWLLDTETVLLRCAIACEYDHVDSRTLCRFVLQLGTELLRR